MSFKNLAATDYAEAIKKLMNNNCLNLNGDCLEKQVTGMF